VSEFVVCEDGASLASAVAERFVNLARDATALRGQFDVALAGGKTRAPLTGCWALRSSSTR
jgi:6-phosphogluconolactonase/glucosamine-6-phosphate isomerase/deaminase